MKLQNKENENAGMKVLGSLGAFTLVFLSGIGYLLFNRKNRRKLLEQEPTWKEPAHDVVPINIEAVADLDIELPTNIQASLAVDEKPLEWEFPDDEKTIEISHEEYASILPSKEDNDAVILRNPERIIAPRVEIILGMVCLAVLIALVLFIIGLGI